MTGAMGTTELLAGAVSGVAAIALGLVSAEEKIPKRIMDKKLKKFRLGTPLTSTLATILLKMPKNADRSLVLADYLKFD